MMKNKKKTQKPEKNQSVIQCKKFKNTGWCVSFFAALFLVNNIYAFDKKEQSVSKGTFFVENITPHAMLVHDENGVWGGSSCQCSPDVHIKKKIDLSGIPEQKWEKVKEARLRVFFWMQDWSFSNGLDESFEIAINGHPHVYQTADGFPNRTSKGQPAEYRWVDFVIPSEELQRGINWVTIKKMPRHEKNSLDDYIYVGIDPTRDNGNSFYTEDNGNTWQDKRRNNVDAQGEYMVRFLLLEEAGMNDAALWDVKNEKIVNGKCIISTGFKKTPFLHATINFESELISGNRPVSALVDYAGSGRPYLEWIDCKGNVMNASIVEKNNLLTSTVFVQEHAPAALSLYSKNPYEEVFRLGFDEGYGNVAADQSGNGLDGEMEAEWSKGSYGTAAYLDGSPEKYIRIELPSRYQVGRTDFTLCAWLKPMDYKQDGKPVARRLFNFVNAYPQHWIVVDFTPDGQLVCNLSLRNGNQYSTSQLVAKQPLPTDKWSHAAIVLDRKNRNLLLYINGKLDSSVPLKEELLNANFISGKPFEIGSVTPRCMASFVDDVVYCKKALEQEKIRDYFNKAACRYGISGNEVSLDTENVEKRRGEAAFALNSVKIDYVPSYLPVTRINMAPKISPNNFEPESREADCRVNREEVVLGNSDLTASFSITDGLTMKSLKSCFLKEDILRNPALSPIFIIEVEGKKFSAKDFSIRKIEPLSNTGEHGVVMDLYLKKYSLAAKLNIWTDKTNELRFGLEIVNEGASSISFKTAFPCFGGIALSGDPKSDYYLFPLYGGIININPVKLRSIYGQQTCWWQMIDLFSPAKGCGLYLRCLDEDGWYKMFSYAKGISYVSAFYDKPGVAPDLYLDDTMGTSEYSSMSIDYLARTREAGKSYRLPAAALGVHRGDWHQAMEIYSKWAHKIWKYRPFPSRMHDVWNVLCQNCNSLFKDGKLQPAFLKKHGDCIYISNYWKFSDLGPWGVPMEELEKVIGKDKYNSLSWTWIKDPITGKLKNSGNRGDYTDYAEYGGLSELRALIENMKAHGKVPILYTAGYLVSDLTETGKKYGQKYGMMNKKAHQHPHHTIKSPSGYVIDYMNYNICPDTTFWQEYFSQTVRKLLQETGALGIYIDEYGYARGPCESAKHEHLYSEPGHFESIKAQAEVCRELNKAMDAVVSDSIIMGEWPGTDYMAQFMDCTIEYDIRRNIDALRKIPCNLFRFYFPECKAIEFPGGDHSFFEKCRFFNGVAQFHEKNATGQYWILKENGDAFDSRQVKPLIPTLREFLYANEFSSAKSGKTIFTFFNTSGDFAGAALELDEKDGYHYVDLMNYQELKTTSSNGKVKVFHTMKNNASGCVAELPRTIKLLSIKDNEIIIDVLVSSKDAEIVLQDSAGLKLVKKKVRAGKNNINCGELRLDMKCKYVIKLFEGKYLKDCLAFGGEGKQSDLSSAQYHPGPQL